MTSKPRDARADYQVGKKLAHVLRGAWRITPPSPDFSETDLEFVLPHLKATHTSALGWWRVRGTPLAKTRVGKSLREHYVDQAVRSAHGAYRVFQYVSALREQNIEPVVFKGWSLAPYYAEPGLRSVGDVDLAVAAVDAERALGIMQALGARPVDVDIHPELSDPAHAAYLPNATWEELVQRSETRVIGVTAVRVLGHADALELVTLHCMRHLAARPLWVADIAAMVESCPPEFDWDRCLATPPYTSWIVFGILLAHKLLGADIEQTPLAARKRDLPAWLERDVLTRWGNPHAMDQIVYPSILQVWRDPGQWQAALQARVPNRFAATLEYNGSLDKPFLARHQIRSIVRNVTSFAQRNAEAKP